MFCAYGRDKDACYGKKNVHGVFFSTICLLGVLLEMTIVTLASSGFTLIWAGDSGGPILDSNNFQVGTFLEAQRNALEE